MSAVLSPHRPTRRPMALSDVDAVHAIETRAYGFPWSRGNFVDSLAAGHVAQVLELDALIGYFVALPGVDELHLLNITIAPPWQGRGHGSALLDAVCAEGRARSLATLWLEVRAGNSGAQALYQRRGFAAVGRRRGYYPAPQGREDAVLMSLALRSNPEAAA